MLDILKRIPALGQVVPHWPVGSDVWSDDAMRAEWSRIFGCHSRDARSIIEAPHEWTRLEDYTGPWCALWSPKTTDSTHLLGNTLVKCIRVIRTKPSYVMIDAEKIMGIDSLGSFLQGMIDEVYSINNITTPIIFWAHGSYYWSRTANGFRWYHLPVFPPFAYSPALYSEDFYRVYQQFKRTREHADMDGVGVFPWLQFVTDRQACRLGYYMRGLGKKLLAGYAIYRASGPVTEDWLLKLEAFAKAYTVKPTKWGKV